MSENGIYLLGYWLVWSILMVLKLIADQMGRQPTVRKLCVGIFLYLVSIVGFVYMTIDIVNRFWGKV